MSDERAEIICLLTQAQENGARQSKACEVIGISAKTYQRWSKPDNDKDGRLDAKHAPGNKLTELERQRVIKTASMPEYANLPANKIVPTLADKGEYIASEATFYRILKEEKLLSHREKSKPARTIIKPKSLTANGPNQVYTWDITYLPSGIRGMFYYLYLVLDIFSRKIIGWQIHTEELSALAADMMIDICQREGIQPNQVTLHSDNGSPMKGATMLATLQELGVIPSFSRPSVSNDNPYSESVFRTLKYRPEYPERAFASIADARGWVQGFVDWYNNEHLHSSIRYVTPEQRHTGKDIEILAQRKEVYLKAKMKNPNRWTGEIRNWDRKSEVHLNPAKGKAEEKEKKVA